MSKVAATYWDNTPQVISLPATRKRGRATTTAARRATSATPQWFVFSGIALITFMLCLAVNFRAYSELSQETTQNEQLALQVQQLTTENQSIQEEISNLKNDSRTIEREARKIGMSRPNEKILVSAN